MKTKFTIPLPKFTIPLADNTTREQIYYNRSTGVHWNTVRALYPLPNDYKEVEYVQNGRNDCIVIDDLLLYHAQPFGVRCKMMVKAKGAFMGAGHDTGSSYTYGLSLWLYTSSKPILYFWGTSSDGGMQIIIPENQFDQTKPYIFDVIKPANGKQAVKIIDTDDPLHFLVDYTKTYGLQAYPTQPYGPFAFFSEVQYSETYPGYYGWPISYRPTSEEHRAFNASYSAGLYTRLYSGIIFYDPGTGIVNKYLYTCFKKSTHQYGLYDAINHVFYTAFEETRLEYWDDPNYYWSHIESASGNTRFDKEKTFINICGPTD